MSYIALTGIVPFKGNTVDQLNHNIQNVDVDFESSKIKLSEKMKKLLKSMLIKDPKKRMSLEDLADELGL